MGPESPEGGTEQSIRSLESDLAASPTSGEPLEVSQLYAGVKRLLDATTADGRIAGDCQHSV